MAGMVPGDQQRADNSAGPIRIFGHHWAVDLLGRQLAQKRLSHAYLFTGPPQVGRGTLARWFAQALLCERCPAHPDQTQDAPGPLGSGCGVCLPCRKVVGEIHPDLRLLNLANQPGKRSNLGIESIRELRSGMAERPFLGQRKVYLIEDADKMTVEASNALLKTLEEPPSFVVLLLVALSDHLMLDTIVSRCQVLALRPLGREQVEQALLMHWGCEQKQARLLASLSLGRLGWGVQALQDQTLLQQREEDLSVLAQLMESGLLERFAFAEQQERRWKRGGRDDVLRLLERWQGWWRDLMMVGQDCVDLVSNVDRLAELRAAGRQIDPEKSFLFLQALRETQQRLQEQVNPRLLFEELLLHLPTAMIAGRPAPSQGN